LSRGVIRGYGVVGPATTLVESDQKGRLLVREVSAGLRSFEGAVGTAASEALGASPGLARRSSQTWRSQYAMAQPSPRPPDGSVDPESR